MAHRALFYLPISSPHMAIATTVVHNAPSLYTLVGPGLLDRANTTGTIGAVYIMSSLHHVTCQIVEVIPPEVDNVVDTTGAGDAFLGGLIVGR